MKIIIKLPVREIELTPNEARLVKTELDELYPPTIFVTGLQQVPNNLRLNQYPNQGLAGKQYQNPNKAFGDGDNQ